MVIPLRLYYILYIDRAIWCPRVGFGGGAAVFRDTLDKRRFLGSLANCAFWRDKRFFNYLYTHIHTHTYTCIHLLFNDHPVTVVPRPLTACSTPSSRAPTSYSLFVLGVRMVYTSSTYTIFFLSSTFSETLPITDTGHLFV